MFDFLAAEITQFTRKIFPEAAFSLGRVPSGQAFRCKSSSRPKNFWAVPAGFPLQSFARPPKMLLTGFKVFFPF
jgi:hypothetical protein